MNTHTTTHQNDIKRLYRSRTNRSWLGVCGGLADYYEADATPIRLLVVVATVLTGVVPGLLAYLAAGIIMPNEPEGE